jgi:hypothetical protein
MMDEDEGLDPQVREALRSYNPPPAAPMAELWQGIEASAVRNDQRIRVPVTLAAAAALALFVVGAGTGYAFARTAVADDSSPVSASDGTSGVSAQMSDIAMTGSQADSHPASPGSVAAATADTITRVTWF